MGLPWCRGCGSDFRPEGSRFEPRHKHHWLSSGRASGHKMAHRSIKKSCNAKKYPSDPNTGVNGRTLLDISFGPPNFCLHSNGALAVSFNRTVTSHDLIESLFSQLQNALSFESEAAHLRSRSYGKEKVHVFYSSNFR